jgi:hypothetical protein
MWVEQAKVQHGDDGSPMLVASGQFRQLDAETHIALAQWGAGRWGFQFTDGQRVLADYPTEQAARTALHDAVGVVRFDVQGDGPAPADKPAATRKRAGSS